VDAGSATQECRHSRRRQTSTEQAELPNVGRAEFRLENLWNGRAKRQQKNEKARIGGFSTKRMRKPLHSGILLDILDKSP
jgi:hypothetical protein